MSRNGWTYTGASAIGTSHQRRDEGCQDHSCVGCSRFKNDDDRSFLFAAVADGAGTAKFAAKGARLTVRILRKEIKRRLSKTGTCLTKDMLREAILMTSNHIEEHANRHGHKSRDYAATLVCAILLPDQAWHLQVGDGAAVFGYGEQRVVGCWPAKGEYGNETFFVTDENVLDQLYVREIQMPDEVTLFTDGLESIALNLKSTQVHQPFYDSFYRVLRHREAGFQSDLAKGLETWMQTDLVTSRTDDDKSLVLISRARVKDSPSV
jgi:Protein phosphatase 2C